MPRLAKPKQQALPLERRPFYRIEEDGAGPWGGAVYRVVDSSTGEIVRDKITRGQAWKWVRERIGP